MRELAGRARGTVRAGGPLSLLSGAQRLVGHYLRAWRAARTLRSEAARIRSHEQAVDLAARFSFEGVRIKPGQVRSEIVALMELVELERLRVVVEIGTKFGGSLFLLARAAPPDALLVSIDIPHAYHPSLGVLYRSFARGRQRVCLIRGDSHDPSTIERLRRVLRGSPIDLLHIDGDHSAAGVRADWQMYAPLVRPGGLIAVHDIKPGAGDVSGFWRELGDRPGTFEIVGHEDQCGSGYGIVRA